MNKLPLEEWMHYNTLVELLPSDRWISSRELYEMIGVTGKAKQRTVLRTLKKMMEKGMVLLRNPNEWSSQGYWWKRVRENPYKEVMVDG